MKKRGTYKIISVFTAACFFAPRFCFTSKSYDDKNGAFNAAQYCCVVEDGAAQFCYVEKTAAEVGAAKKAEYVTEISGVKTEETTVQTRGSVKKSVKNAFRLGGLTVKTPFGVYEYRYPQLTLISGERTLLGFESEVDRIFKDNYVAATDAELIFTPKNGQAFSATSEKCGKQIKKQAIRAAIAYALACGKSVIELKAEPVEPKVFYNDVLKKCTLRSSFRTYYGNSPEDRKNNIGLAAAAINGAVIPVGGEFSFNAVVGERSEARGYKSAKIIINGEFAEGIGGGVCQVSGTVYNAALLAGLTVTECHRHSLPVGYLSPSFDAMVSGDFCDLVFKNDTASEIYILCRADGEFLNVQIYGLARDYEYKLISRVVEVIEAKTVEVCDESLTGGERVQIKQPKNGLKSEGYLCAYKNGDLVFTRKIRADEYAAQNGVIKIGKNKSG